MIRAAVTLAAVMALAAGYVAAGPTGFFVALVVAGALLLVALRLRIPSPPQRAAQPARKRSVDHDFADYDDIAGAFGMSTSSGWHFHRVTAPRLHRLLGELLVYRRRTGIGADGTAARDALGPDLWPLLDPARPVPAGQDQRGPTLATLRQIVERLEDL